MKIREKRRIEGTKTFANSWTCFFAEILMGIAFFAGFAIPLLFLDLNQMFDIISSWEVGFFLTIVFSNLIILFLGFLFAMFFAVVIGFSMEFLYNFFVKLHKSSKTEQSPR